MIAGLLFMAGMRRSEVSAVEWRDVTDATDGAGVLVAVRQSKTNPDGDTADLRYLKTGAARAVRTLRAHRTPVGATGPAPTARVVPLTGQQIGQRFTTAAGEPPIQGAAGGAVGGGGGDGARQWGAGGSVGREGVSHHTGNYVYIYVYNQCPRPLSWSPVVTVASSSR